VNQEPRTGEQATVGIDAGASLLKLAIEHPSGDLELETFALAEREALVHSVLASGPAVVGLTGGGAAPIQELLSPPSTALNEFSAWAAGAARLLDRAGEDAPERYLLVSLGTGTSVQLIDGDSAQRVAGTALGGGTVLGLGRLLTRARTFDELCGLAASGSRRAVDLLLSDVYEGGEVPLADHLTASSFGRLAREPDVELAPADIAAGLFHLVGENVGLIIGQAAAASGVRRVAIGGSSLVGNTLLATTVCGVLSAYGCDASILTDGEYTGALGAIELVRAQR
jgi:type II pantothenate kinase